MSQSQSLENQEQLMNQTMILNNVINSSSKTVQVLFEDLKVNLVIKEGKAIHRCPVACIIERPWCQQGLLAAVGIL